MEYGGCPREDPHLGERDHVTQTSQMDRDVCSESEPDRNELSSSKEEKLPESQKQSEKIVIRPTKECHGTLLRCFIPSTGFDVTTVETTDKKQVTYHEEPTGEEEVRTDYSCQVFKPNETYSSQLDGVEEVLTLFECGICGDLFSQKEWLTTHLAEHVIANNDCSQVDCDEPIVQGSQEFIETDGDSFSREKLLTSQLAERINVNSRETNTEASRPQNNNLYFDVNGKHLRRNDHAIHHSTTNTEETPVTERKIDSLRLCEFCGRTFHAMCLLRSHQQNVHMSEQDRPYFCHLCGRGFVRKNMFDRHLRVHVGEKPFECKICEKKFTQNNQLTSHIRHAHTANKDKPYICETCSKGFITKSNFVWHLKIHSGEKAFECKVCGKKFTQENQLKSHTLHAHTANHDLPYICQICTKGFVKKCYLRTHLKKHDEQKSAGI